MQRFLLAIVALGALAAEPVAAWELRGTVSFVARKGKPLPAEEQAGLTVVLFRPDGDVAAPAPGRFEVVTENKRFEPRVVVVPVGSEVAFPNRDSILHNVFSLSDPKTFDVGLYRQGEGPSVELDEAGLVQVYCNVHHDMAAWIWVVETPYTARPEPDGSFDLSGPGSAGELTVWHPRAEPLKIRIDSAPSEPLALTLTLDKRQVPRHLDKHGQRYKRNEYP